MAKPGFRVFLNDRNVLLCGDHLAECLVLKAEAIRGWCARVVKRAAKSKSPICAKPSDFVGGKKNPPNLIGSSLDSHSHSHSSSHSKSPALVLRELPSSLELLLSFLVFAVIV